MLKIALTGGIASGKSTVANLFREFDVPIIDADTIARELTQKKSIYLDKIIQHFGKDILDQNSTLDRQKLRNLIFKDPNERRWLENLLHPTIRTLMSKKAEQYKVPYVIFVIPLLTETGKIENFDRILVVDAPESLRKQRLQSRDQLPKAQMEAVFNSQATSPERLKIANDVIHNDGSIDHLRDRVKMLHSQYLELAKDTE